MAEELKFAVKCRNSAQRPVFKRRCSGCPIPAHGGPGGVPPLASSPGLYVPESGQTIATEFNACCNHRPFPRDLPLPILSSSPTAQGKGCLHHHTHHINSSPSHIAHNHLPSSFNYTECHTPPVSNLVYLNRSKSVGSRPGEGTRFGYGDHRDYTLENETCINWVII